MKVFDGFERTYNAVWYAAATTCDPIVPSRSFVMVDTVLWPRSVSSCTRNGFECILQAQGNAAFQAGNFEEAIQHFTAGIAVAPDNHVLFSNRSAAKVQRSAIPSFALCIPAGACCACMCISLRLMAAVARLHQWMLCCPSGKPQRLLRRSRGCSQGKCVESPLYDSGCSSSAMYRCIQDNDAIHIRVS